MPTNPYRKSFQINPKNHNVPPHDAILLTSDSVSAGVGASYSASVYMFGESVQYGANGKPRPGTDNYAAPTGDNILLRGTKSGEAGFAPQQIFPIQIKGVEGVTGCNLYALRY